RSARSAGAPSASRRTSSKPAPRRWPTRWPCRSCAPAWPPRCSRPLTLTGSVRVTGPIHGDNGANANKSLDESPGRGQIAPMKPRTLFEKIWDAHVVKPASADTPAILYVDLHLIHEVTSPQAFTWLRERKVGVRRPERTVATMDHSTPTTPRGRDGRIPIADSAAAAQISALEKNCQDFGIELHRLGSEGQGIVHVL